MSDAESDFGNAPDYDHRMNEPHREEPRAMSLKSDARKYFEQMKDDPEEFQKFLDENFPGSLYIPHMANDQDFRSMIEMCNGLLTRKGHDYTQGAEGDRGRLLNFYQGAERLGLKPIQVLAVYLHKHQSAIDTFIQKGQVESEAIDGRVADVINYYLLMWKLIQYERRCAANHINPMTGQTIEAEQNLVDP